jgi:uncharacterized membrane protein
MKKYSIPKQLIVFALIVSLTLQSSCGTDDEPAVFECENVEASFTADIKSIIDTNCAISACHAGNTGQVNLTTYQNVSARAQTIRNRVVSKTMPPPGRPALSDEQIKQIACWVEQGAQDN